MATYQDLVDLARIPLNDDDKVRYPDDVLLLFAHHAILYLLRRRPDLFIGLYAALPTEAELTSLFPLGPEYLQVVADAVTARAEMTDDEHDNSGRMALYAQLVAVDAPS